MPTFNEAKVLGDTLAAAKGLVPDELIVVDGGSSDDTVALANRVADRVLAVPRGRGQQLNAGGQAAQGDVLIFLHADSRLASDAFSQLRAACADPGLVGGSFRQRIDHPAPIYRWIEWGNSLRSRWWRLPYGDQAQWVRRSVFHELGGFREQPLLEDLHFARAVARYGRTRELPAVVTTSARRWERRGPLRTTLRNWTILAGAACGVSTERLARWYGVVR